MEMSKSIVFTESLLLEFRLAEHKLIALFIILQGHKAGNSLSGPFCKMI